MAEEEEWAVSMKAKRHPTEKHGALEPPADRKASYILGEYQCQLLQANFYVKCFGSEQLKHRTDTFSYQVLTTSNHVPQQPRDCT